MEKKYKVHLVDMANDYEIIKRLIINEDQKKILDLLRQNDLYPEWLKVEIVPEDILYEDLTGHFTLSVV